jgi:hypothetical protein
VLIAGQALAQVVVGGGGSDGQGGVEVDVECDRRAERVEVEAAARFGEALLDAHPLGVAADDLLRRTVAVVGEVQVGMVVAEAADGDLAQRDRAAAGRSHPVRRLRALSRGRGVRG